MAQKPQLGPRPCPVQEAVKGSVSAEFAGTTPGELIENVRRGGADWASIGLTPGAYLKTSKEIESRANDVDGLSAEPPVLEYPTREHRKTLLLQTLVNVEPEGMSAPASQVAGN
ncbi:MAG: hypothetical protein HY551_04715 [Elusimicrobia bacterium]|nr:hypothetical protein [Elusimicrobiota bacterium]